MSHCKQLSQTAACHVTTVTYSIWHSDQDGHSSSATWKAKTCPVWDNFKYDVSLGKTVCQIDVNGKHCVSTFKGKLSTNLKAHMKSKHGQEYEELLQKEKEITRKNDLALANSKKSQCNFKGQQTITQVLQKAKKYNKQDPQYKCITRN